jgi:hypothetical protein
VSSDSLISRLVFSNEEEDTCVSYEEEDTCVSSDSLISRLVFSNTDMNTDRNTCKP